MKAAYQNIHPFSKLGVSALVAILGLFLFMIIAAVVAIPIFGMDAFSSLVNSSVQYSSENIALLKYFQSAQSIGLFVVPALLLAYLFGENMRSYLSLNRKTFFVSAAISVLIVYAASPLINVLGVWNANLSLPEWMGGLEAWMKRSEDAAAELTELFVNAENIRGLMLNIVVIGVLPAVGEELLFRGVIQRVFTDWTKNKHLAIWITAILFSALHMQFYGFLPRMVLGAIFGYLLIWSGNLWLPILAHFINNTTAVIAYYYYNKGMLEVDPDTIGTGDTGVYAALVSVIILVVLFRIFFNLKSRKAYTDLTLE